MKVTANDWNAGGFVGYIEENVTIHNCISYGDVHSKVNRWEPKVGGFTGISNLNCSIDNSYAAGKVTAESTDYKAGGLLVMIMVVRLLPVVMMQRRIQN